MNGSSYTIRKFGDREARVIDRDTLIDLYYSQSLSLTRIAKDLGVCRSGIQLWMIKFGIPRRDYKQANKLIWENQETRQKQSTSHQGKSCPWSKETGMNNVAHLSQFWYGPNNPFKGQHHSPKTKSLLSSKIAELHKTGLYDGKTNGKKMKKLWQDKEFRERVIKAQAQGNSKRPTQPEQQLIQLIEENKFPFKYTGEGSFVIGGYIPDFVNTNGKKQIIELFGDYWHNRDNTPWHQTELGRIMAYSQFGYKTLIIWEHELKQPQEVVKKVKGFAKVRRCLKRDT